MIRKRIPMASGTPITCGAIKTAMKSPHDSNLSVSPTSDPEPVQHSPRTTFMTFFCAVFFLLFAVTLIPYITVVFPASNSMAMATYLVANWLLTFASFVGYWRMAKWGVWLYGTLCVIGIAVGIMNSYPNTARSMLVPILILTIGIVQYRRMR